MLVLLKGRSPSCFPLINFPFLCLIAWFTFFPPYSPYISIILPEKKKKGREKQLKRSQCFRGRLLWIKGKNGKRWNLGKIKWQLFFKVQVRDETTKNRQKKTPKNKKKHTIFDLPFSCLILSEKKKEKSISSKCGLNVKKRRAEIWNPPVVDLISQIDQSVKVMFHRTSWNQSYCFIISHHLHLQFLD